MTEGMFLRIKEVVSEGRDDDVSDELLTSAILRAMREPTEAMVKAMPHFSDVGREVWQNAIDAILKTASSDQRIMEATPSLRTLYEFLRKPLP